MPRKKQRYIDILNQDKHKETFKRLFECEFWRCEYTKRKYILDVQCKINTKIHSLNINSGSDLCDNAIDYVVYHSKNVLGVNHDNSMLESEHCDYLEKVIVAYHNFLNNYDPKYCIVEDFKLPFKFYKYLEFLDNDQIKSLAVLHRDSVDYGFYPFDMTTIRNLDKVENYVNKYFIDNGVYPFFQNSFIMKDHKDPDFFYKDIYDRKFFISENSDTTIYVYMRCLEEEDTLAKLAVRALTLINTALKNKPIHTAGNRDDADIQICVYDRKLLVDKNNLKSILMNNFAAYRNFYFPEKFSATTDTIKVAKTIMVPEYEQVPFNIRAVGLWIWDQVNLYNSKVSDAIDKSRKIEGFRLHNNIEMTTIERAYRLAKRSVNEMKVLKFSDLN